MTDDDMHSLGHVLDRATDLVAPTGRGVLALAEARRRRAQRRVVAGAAVAVVVVVGVGVVATSTGDGSEPSPTEPTRETPATTEAAAEPLLHAQWDPFDVADAPVRPSVLAEQVEPPASAPSVLDAPMPAAVLAWPQEGKDLLLLGSGGQWRSVPGTAQAVRGTLRDVVKPALTHDGTQVAMATIDGLLVVDVARGQNRLVPWPALISEPWDAPPSVRWLPGGEEIAILHWRDVWVMSLDGSIRRPPYGSPYGSGLAVDPDGLVVEQAEAYSGLEVWRDDELVRDLSTSYWLGSIAASDKRIVLIGSGSELPAGTGPIVLDALTGDLLAYAPVADPDSAYGNGGHLRALGFLEPDTVLMMVGPVDFPRVNIEDATWHLVAWNFLTGRFQRVASGAVEMSGIDVAIGALEAG